VLDQFDLALDHESQEATADSLIKGIQIVKNELLKVLDKAGIVPIEPKIGDSFDPNLHEAMLKQPTDDVAPGHISLLIQPGWAFGVMVIRPAKVAIAPEDE
jgi:molecular chaperone GrpE